MDDAMPGPFAPSPEGASPSRRTWTGSVVGWHAAFWVVIALGTLNALIGTTDGDRTAPWVQIGLLAVMGAAYLVAAPHIGFATVTWRMWIYVIVAIVGVGVACWSDAALSLLLFIVYPQMWIFAGDRLSTGIALNAALTVSSLCGFMTGYGEWTLDALRDIGPQMAVSLAFSVLLGIWVSRIVQQSIERGRLIAELEATRSALAGAHHEQGVMAERERLAREIHDTLAQGFTSIVMLAQAAAAGRDPAAVADRLTMIEEVARDNLAEARALVAAFIPLELTGSGVAEALTRLAERFGRETGLPVEVETVGEVMGLRRDQEVVLLRVVQEALTNVRRHAAAGRVRIRLVSDAEGARVEVSDDGVGFVAEETSGGFGLTGMRSRLGEVGGRLDVASAPGAGTLVRVRVPRSDEIEEEPS